MKVIFVTEQKIMGGGEWNLLFLIEKMLTYDIEIGVLSCNDILLSLLPDTVKKYKSEDIGRRGWLSSLPLIWRQVDLEKITKKKWDIIHFYSPNPTCRMLFSHAKKVLTVHGPWERANGLRGLQLQFLIDKFLPVSSDVDRSCTVSDNKKKCIELGIKPSNYSKCIDDVLLCNKGQFNFLCLGRYQSVKGQDLLLSAVAAIQSKIPKTIKINLSFYGEVDESRKEDILFYDRLLSFKERYFNFDNVTVEFYKSDRNIEILYDWADVCIIPSRYESFSMVAAESLSFGVPVIVSNNGAPHAFIKGRKSGLIFENDCVDSLALCLIDFIQSPNQFNDFLGYRERFSISRQVEETLDIYRTLI